MYFCSGDIECAFYRMRLPAGMEHSFRLPGVAARHLGISSVSGVAAGPDVLITPCLAVLPMGWSWALHICQAVLRAAIAEAGFSTDQVVEDGRPGVRLGTATATAVAGYVDNFVVASRDAQASRQGRDAIAAVLTKHGLVVHDLDEPTSDGARFVGLELGHGRMLSIKRRGLWKLAFGLRELLRRGRCSGTLLRSMLGHLTWAALLRREALAFVNHCYAFAEAAGTRVVPLWASVRQELSDLLAVLPLLRADVGAEWDEVAVCSDASPFGIGVCTKVVGAALAGETGRQLERWRYKVSGAAAARARALGPDRLAPGVGPDDDEGAGEVPTSLDDLSGGLPLEPLWKPGLFDPGGRVDDGARGDAPSPAPFDPDRHDLREAFLRTAPRLFDEVPASVWERAGWTTVHASRVMGTHNILALEGEALHRAFKHALRSLRTHGRRVLFLVDNLPLAMAMAKGRAKSPLLTRVLLKMAALSLASGTRAVVRWIPSEFNAADDPSRGKAGFFASPAVGDGEYLGGDLFPGPPGLLDDDATDELPDQRIEVPEGSPAAPAAEAGDAHAAALPADQRGRAPSGGPRRPRSAFAVPLRRIDVHRAKAYTPPQGPRARGRDDPSGHDSARTADRGDRRVRRARPRPVATPPAVPMPRVKSDLFLGSDPRPEPFADDAGPPTPVAKNDLRSLGPARPADRPPDRPRCVLPGNRALIPLAALERSTRTAVDAHSSTTLAPTVDSVTSEQRSLQRRFREARARAWGASRYRIFLEPFGGSRGLGPALRRLGYGVLSLDAASGPLGDATDAVVYNALSGWIQSGALVGLWLSLPCVTWSAAGPLAFRDPKHLWGMPGLSEADRAKVEQASTALRVSLRLLRAGRRLGVPTFFEHPRGSLVWRVPELRALCGLADARHFDYDACQYGAKWRRGSSVVAWGVPELTWHPRQCSGRHGLCSRTGARHIDLNGRSPTGPLWSTIAAAKPPGLCRELAASFDQLVKHRRANKLFRIVLGAA